MGNKEIKTWWENHALDFQEEYKVKIDVNYGPGSPNEDNLKLLGNVKNKNILEIGCGGAQCGIALAKQGAKILGIDNSSKQLMYAKKLMEENNVKIELHQGDITTLLQIETESQDIVFSSWALLYVEDLATCFKEVYRVLKKGGIFVFSIIHPFWLSINKENKTLKRSYFETGLYKGPKYGSEWSAYHYKISDLVNFIIDSGLTLKRIIEPDSRKTYEEDFSRKRYTKSKKETMKFIPRTMIIKAKKV